MPKVTPKAPATATSSDEPVDSRRLTSSSLDIEDACEKNNGSTSTHNKYIVWKSLWALRLAIFADAVNSQILGPNYSLLVMKNGHEVSFL